MAAGLGFKTFNTGDVLSAADVNGYLMQGVLVFADSAARSAAITSPQEGQYSFLKDTNSTEYYTGSAWAAVGGGGGGKVLQVVQGTTATQTYVQSTTYTDTTLTATITPSASTSKILVLLSQQGTIGGDGNLKLAGIRLLRGATAILNDINNPEVIGTTISGAGQIMGFTSYSYLDSPATTSATTYKTQGRVYSTGSDVSITFQKQSTTSSIILLEIGA
jgi:hypothetical protein